MPCCYYSDLLLILKDLDSRLRNHTYNDNTWQQLSGKSLDELWNNYTANPSI